MSDTLVLLMDGAAWTSYKHRMMTDKGLDTDQVIWGRGPTSYPCLAAGFFMDVDKSPGSAFVCCYVYVEQAMGLIRAAGISMGGDAAPHTVNVVGPEQAQFNEAILAHIAAILKVLVSTSITTEEHYGPLYAQEVQAVEQRQAKDMDAMLAQVKGSLKKEE